MKIPEITEGIRIKYVPGAEDLITCRNMGMQIANKLKDKLGD